MTHSSLKSHACPMAAPHIWLICRALRTAQPVAIATGERLRTAHAFAEHLLPSPVVDIIQPDVSMVGGIRASVEIGAMASAAQVAMAPHCPYGPVQFAASMQVAATSPAHLIQEFQSSEEPVQVEVHLEVDKIGPSNYYLSRFPLKEVMSKFLLVRDWASRYWKSALRNTWTCGTLILPPYGVIQTEVMLSGNHPNMVSGSRPPIHASMGVANRTGKPSRTPTASPYSWVVDMVSEVNSTIPSSGFVEGIIR